MRPLESDGTNWGRLLPHFWQLVRYGIVGCLLMLLYLGLAILLNSRFGLSPAVASPLSFVLLLPLVYLGQAVLVFRARCGNRTQMVRFFVTAANGFVISASVVPTLGAWFALPAQANFLVVSCVVPVMNFLIFRFWVFRAA